MVRVSVIVPVYNAGLYLRQCLDSICAQKLSEIEIICVDDCSYDESPEILSEYASRDSRFKIIRSKFNQGPSGSRNTGMRAACGEYVGFVDSDDWVDPDYFEAMIKKADEMKTDILLNTDYVIERATGSEPGKWLTYPAVPEAGEWLTPDFCANDAHSLVYLHLYRRSFIIENRLTFPFGYNLHEDDFFHKISSICAERIFAFSGPSYHFRHHDGSLLDNRSLKNEPYVRMFSALRDYFGARILEPTFKLKLFSSPLFSNVSCEEEFQGLKQYLLSLSEYFEKSGVECSDFDYFAINGILSCNSYDDYLNTVSDDPWQKYTTSINIVK